MEGLHKFHFDKGIGGAEMERVGVVKIKDLATQQGEVLYENVELVQYTGSTEKKIAEIDFIAIKNGKVVKMYSAKYESKRVNIIEYQNKLYKIDTYVPEAGATALNVEWKGNNTMNAISFRNYLSGVTIATMPVIGVVLQEPSMQSHLIQLPLTKEQWSLEVTKAVFNLYP